ncbi:LysR family transcriptional regulator [Vibrio sp. TBV020]|uniref:LysR family transcriptional regulator n=1 Tax=Vibrio sp. TBV020 TaxID=3137398 RepID=UPI0038CD49BE
MSDPKRVEKLMLFNEVAFHLSFSKAADQLGVSKSYLSSKIKSLELELQTPLIVRTTRSVRLTPEGAQIYAQTQRIKNQVTELDRLLNLQASDVTGVLRLTAPKMFAESVLYKLCAEFKRNYPEVRFEINSSYEVLSITDTEVDFAFRATRNPPENIIASHLFDYEHCLVASPEYLSRYEPLTQVEQLSQHECLATLHQKEWPLASTTVEAQGWLHSNQNELLKSAAINHMGIIRIASYFVKDELTRGELVQVLPDETRKESGSIYLLYPQLVFPSAKAQAFIQFVKRYFHGE